MMYVLNKEQDYTGNIYKSGEPIGSPNITDKPPVGLFTIRSMQKHEQLGVRTNMVQVNLFPGVYATIK